MKSRDTLDTVLQVNQAREQEATRQLVEARNRLAEQQARYDELQGYRRQYLQRFQQVGSQGLGVGQLNEYRVFLARLDQALEQQQQILERCRQELARCQQHWLARRQEKKAVEKLAERRAEAALRSALRREQKESDEHAGRQRRGGMA